MEEDEFLKVVKRAETDLEFSKEVQNGANKLKYDFTQHYDRPLDGGGAGITHQETQNDEISTRTAVSIVAETAS